MIAGTVLRLEAVWLCWHPRQNESLTLFRTFSNRQEAREFVGAGLAPPAVTTPPAFTSDEDVNRTKLSHKYEMGWRGCCRAERCRVRALLGARYRKRFRGL